MATTNNDYGPSTGAGVIGVIRARMRDYRAYRRTRVDLKHLSDRDLADLGLSRYDIETLARRGVLGL